MYETLTARTKQRLELIEMGILIDNEIIRRSFTYRVKRFVLSLIKQRELIIRMDRSKKNVHRMLTLIDDLRKKIQACPNKDWNTARFFLANEEDIRELIPGVYPNKRFEKFILLRDQAREIQYKHAL